MGREREREGAPQLAEHGGFAPVYMVELFAEQPIVIDETAVLGEMKEALGRVHRSESREVHHFFLEDFPIQLKDARICGQVTLLCAPRGKPAWNIEDSIRQSWALDNAAERVALARHSVLLTDLMSSSLPHDQRRTILAASLRAILRHSNADLVHFVSAQQFLDAKLVLSSLDREEEVANPVTGFLNVRLFNVNDSPGDTVMDTLGLTALGLTDFQIHFRDLHPRTVAGCLYGIGAYVFEKGDVILDGQTVEGTTPGSKWRCRQEVSLLAPKRVVLDIDPGTPYAAGKRK